MFFFEMFIHVFAGLILLIAGIFLARHMEKIKAYSEAVHKFFNTLKTLHQQFVGQDMQTMTDNAKNKIENLRVFWILYTKSQNMTPAEEKEEFTEVMSGEKDNYLKNVFANSEELKPIITGYFRGKYDSFLQLFQKS